MVITKLTTLCLNGTLSCVDFMDVIMGDIPEIYSVTLRHIVWLTYIEHINAINRSTPYRGRMLPHTGVACYPIPGSHVTP